MSHKASALVRSRIVGSAAQKAVLDNMADKASGGGEGVFSSKRTIAAEREMGLSTVKHAISDLIEKGLIHEAGYRTCATAHTVVCNMDIAAIKALPKWKAPEDRKAPETDLEGVQSGPQTIPEPWWRW